MKKKFLARNLLGLSIFIVSCTMNKVTATHNTLPHPTVDLPSLPKRKGTHIFKDKLRKKIFAVRKYSAQTLPAESLKELHELYYKSMLDTNITIYGLLKDQKFMDAVNHGPTERLFRKICVRCGVEICGGAVIIRSSRRGRKQAVREELGESLLSIQRELITTLENMFWWNKNKGWYPKRLGKKLGYLINTLGRRTKEGIKQTLEYPNLTVLLRKALNYYLFIRILFVRIGIRYNEEGKIIFIQKRGARKPGSKLYSQHPVGSKNREFDSFKRENGGGCGEFGGSVFSEVLPLRVSSPNQCERERDLQVVDGYSQEEWHALYDTCFPAETSPMGRATPPMGAVFALALLTKFPF